MSEDVIAAVLLLHERSVDEVAPQLSAGELERVIVLVGRSPRLYAPGTLQALESNGAVLLWQPAETAKPTAIVNDRTIRQTCHPRPSDEQPSSRIGPEAQQSPPEHAKGAEATQTPPKPKTRPSG